MKRWQLWQNTFSSFFHHNTSLWLSGHCPHNCQHMIEDRSVGNQMKSWTTHSITLSAAKAPPWLCFPWTHRKATKLSNELLLTCCGNYFTSAWIISGKMLLLWNLTFYNMLKAIVIHRRFNKQNHANKKSYPSNSAGKTVTKHENNSGMEKDMQDCCFPETFF